MRSEWSTPVPDGTGRALDFHLAEFARWLTTAGAEPRLALVLCTGPAAKARFIEGIAIDRIDVVHAPATPARPLHPKLLAHQGDHFNTTLFVVDGFEHGDPTPLFHMLDGQRGVMTRSATWTAVVIESLGALEALERAAPGLTRAFMRRCLVIDSAGVESRQAPLDVGRQAAWLERGWVAERVFHHVMTSEAAPLYSDFGRLVRTGYVAALTGRRMHPERQRLVELWCAGPEARALPFPPTQAGPAAAQAIGRHLPHLVDEGLSDALGEVIGLDAAARLAAGLPVGDAPVVALMARLHEMTAGERPAAPGLMSKLKGLADELPRALRAHAWELIAGVAAALDDLERCEAALAEAARHARAAGALELWFDVLEKQTQIHAFLDRRSVARETLSALEALAPRLHSPLYAGRRLLARGEYLLGLDPARAEADLARAERLFTSHGYPRWAERARGGQP